jgi:hypothetical protein
VTTTNDQGGKPAVLWGTPYRELAEAEVIRTAEGAILGMRVGDVLYASVGPVNPNDLPVARQDDKAEELAYEALSTVAKKLRRRLDRKGERLLIDYDDARVALEVLRAEQSMRRVGRFLLREGLARVWGTLFREERQYLGHTEQSYVEGDEMRFLRGELP